VRAHNLKFRLHRRKKIHISDQKVFLDTCAVEKDTFSEFIDLLYDYQDIFAYSATNIPKCNLLKCHLFTYSDAKPTRCRPYRLSDEKKLQVDIQLDEMLTAGVIAE